MRKAGRRQEHREVHRHLGQAGQSRELRRHAVSKWPTICTGRRLRPASLGRAVVAHLRLALGEHRYMVTPNAAVALGSLLRHRRRSSQCRRAKSDTAERPEGLVGLGLFAAARPTKRANKSNRITDVFRDLPHPTAVALSHLLLGTDHHPEAALLWRHVSRCHRARGAGRHRGGLAGRSSRAVSDHPGLFPTPPAASAGPVPQGRRPAPGLRVASANDADLEVAMCRGNALAI